MAKSKSQPSKAENNQRWEEFTREIIAQTNIEDAYRKMGVEVVGNRPNSTGWLAVRAINRDDSHPSAAINVGDDGRRGRYRDLGGDGDSLSLFDFALKYGNLGLKDWHAARMHFATEAGIARRAPKTKSDELRDSIKFLPHLAIEKQIRGFVAAYPGVTAEAVKLCGGVIGKWPANAPEPNYCIVLPAYGPELLDSDPRGYTIMASSGSKLRVFAGEGVPLREEKRINRGPSGLVGRLALKHLHEAEIVWKVEGISDLLALQALIPEELRHKHIVLTNNSGAREIHLPSEVAHLFATKTVCIVHDCDTPGQDGAAVWVNALANANCTVKNVVLPFEITEDHGKDLRDFVNELGGTYQQLLEMAAGTQAAAVAKLPKDATQPSSVSSGTSDSTVDDEFDSVIPADAAASSPGTHKPEQYSNNNNRDHQVEQEFAPPSPATAAGMTTHQAVLKRIGLQVLGELAGTNKIICHSNALHKTFEITDVSRFKYEHLLQQVGDHCEKLVVLGPNVDATQVHFHAVTRAIAVEGGRRTVSGMQQLGQGIWIIGDRLVLVNHRETAVLNGSFALTNSPCIDGRLIDHTGADRWFDFDELLDLYAKSESPEWCREQYNESVSLFSRWNNWAHEDTPHLLAAMTICSWLQTVWEWRPIVAISGATNTGKSMLLEKTLPYVFGNLALSMAKPSEAGLRQNVGHTAKVPLIDEFENDKHRESVLELMRTASRGSKISRGTANQRGTQFGLKHIVWCGAIELGLKREADRNRMILLELNRVEAGPRMELPSSNYLLHLGMRLLAVSLRYWRECRGMSRELCRMPYEGVDSRAVECYGLPFAMIAAIHGEGIDNARERMMATFELREMVSSASAESDEEDLLLAILGSLVDCGGGKRMTVSELLTADKNFTYATIPIERDEILQRNGIRVIERSLFLWQKSLCGTVLKSTPYASQSINQILKRVNGAQVHSCRMLGCVAKGVLIPLESLSSLVPKVVSSSGVVAEIDFGDDTGHKDAHRGVGDVDSI